MGKIVTLYNNKGGVSKTTTLFNLGCYLATTGKKTLIIDCDPQCNATELFYSSTDLLDDFGHELPGTSIYQAFLPRFRGEAARVDVTSIDLIESVRYSNLFLLRGDLDWAQAESYFANAWNLAITEDLHSKNTYLSPFRLFHDLLRHYDFDYILCDVGPSAGHLTRMIVLACDNLLLPLIPDRFSNQAITVLGKILVDWVNRHKVISDSSEPFGMERYEGNPAFCGAIIQNFKIYRSQSTRAYAAWQDAIKSTLKTHIIERVEIRKSEKFDANNPFIANIRDFAAMAPVAQAFGKAMFDISKEDTKYASGDGLAYSGAVWSGWINRQMEYRSEIKKVAEAI